MTFSSLLFVVLFCSSIIIELNNAKFIFQGHAKNRIQNRIQNRIASNHKLRPKRSKIPTDSELFVPNDFDVNEFKRLANRYRNTKDGKIRYKTKQYYNNIPIHGAYVVIEEDPHNNNQATPILGRYYNKNDIRKYIHNTNINSIINEEDAANIALTLYNKTIADINGDYIAKLYIYFVQNIPRLTYFISFSFVTVIVDSNNGEVINVRSNLRTSGIEACGIGGNPKTGEINYCTDERYGYTINNIPNLSNDRIIIYNTNNGGSSDGDTFAGWAEAMSAAEIVKCSEGSSSSFSSSLDEREQCYINDTVLDGGNCIACDVYTNLNIVFDLYDKWFDGFSPLMDENKPIPIYIHWMDGFTNAGSFTLVINGVETQMMLFGDGNPGYGKYAPSVLSIAAHEFGHAYTAKVSGLGDGEASGMNEAYSDLIAQVAKYYFAGCDPDSVDWLLGCDYEVEEGKCSRYLMDPPLDGKSIDNYKNDYYWGINEHHSAGIYNKAWYILYNTYSWSMEMLFKIVSTAQENWDEDTRMNEGVCGILAAVHALYGNTTEADELSDNVMDAFEEVGVKCFYFPDNIDNPQYLKINTSIIISGDEDEWKHFYFNSNDINNILDDEMIVISTLNGYGDVDLYLSTNNMMPSLYQRCFSNSVGTAESCTVYIDEEATIYYISIYGWQSYNSVELSYNIIKIPATKAEFNNNVYFPKLSFIGNPKQYFYVDIEEKDYTIDIYLSGGTFYDPSPLLFNDKDYVYLYVETGVFPKIDNVPFKRKFLPQYSNYVQITYDVSNMQGMLVIMVWGQRPHTNVDFIIKKEQQEKASFLNLPKLKSNNNKTNILSQINVNTILLIFVLLLLFMIIGVQCTRYRKPSTNSDKIYV